MTIIKTRFLFLILSYYSQDANSMDYSSQDSNPLDFSKNSRESFYDVIGQQPDSSTGTILPSHNTVRDVSHARNKHK